MLEITHSTARTLALLKGQFSITTSSKFSVKLLYAPRVEKWVERTVVFVNALTRRPLVPLHVTRAPMRQVIYGILILRRQDGLRFTSVGVGENRLMRLIGRSQIVYRRERVPVFFIFDKLRFRWPVVT